MPGWGQGHVLGAATGGKWFGAYVAGSVGWVLVGYVPADPALAFDVVFIASILGFLLFSVVHAYQAAKKWNQAQHLQNPPARAGRLLGLGALALLVFPLYWAAIIGPIDVFATPNSKDFSHLQPPEGVEVIQQNVETYVVGDEYRWWNLWFTETSEFTYAFHAEAQVPLSICIADREQEDAFRDHANPSCLLKIDSKFSGVNTVVLNPGDYMILFRTANGQDATVHESFWFTPQDASSDGEH